MNVKLSTIGLIIGGVLGAILVGVLLVFLFFPKELAVREAERLIEETTGRELTLGQDVEVRFWPSLGFSVDQASLSNPEGFSTEEPFVSARRIAFAVKVMPLLRGAIEVNELTLEGADLRLAAKEDGAANWAFPTEQTQPDQQTTIEDLRLDDVRLTDSRISFQGAEGEPLILEDVDVSLKLDSLDAPAALEAALNYRGQRIETQATVGLPRAILQKGETPLQANVEAAALNAQFDGAFNVATGALNGRLNANGSSLRRLMAWAGTPMGEGGGFNAFRVSGQMAHEGQTTALNNATLALDQIEARGNIALVTQENGRLRVNGALSMPSINANTYLPAPAQGEGGVQAGAAWPTTPIDLSGLRAMDANLALTVGALQFQRMSFADVALNLRVANGAADARLSRISLYGGGGTARMIADGSGRTPRIAVEIDAQNVQAETLLRDAIGFDKIAGRGRLTASLVGQGGDQAAIMRSLAGNASFNFNDGQWKGVNLAQTARALQAIATGQTAAGEGAATDFAELSATFAVASGQMATDNLRMLNPFVRLEGQGVVDIGAQSIDMRIAPRAVRSMEGQGGDAAATGLGVPFRVSGPWSGVRFRPALGDVVRNELNTRARDILRRQPQGSALGQLGDVLFGRAPAAEGEAAPAAETPAPATGQASQTQSPPAAEQPAPPRPEDRARDALGGLLRNAIGGDRPKQEPPPEPAPAPTP